MLLLYVVVSFEVSTLREGKRWCRTLLTNTHRLLSGFNPPLVKSSPHLATNRAQWFLFQFHSCPALLTLDPLHYVTMNILESQVTDLNYLAESPIALTGSMTGQQQSSSTESPAERGTNSGKKRKSEEANGNGDANTHTRAKRNRYISIAWLVISIFPGQVMMIYAPGSTQPHHNVLLRQTHLSMNLDC